MSLLSFGDVSEVVDRINEMQSTLKSPAELAWTTDPVDEFEKEVPTCLVYPAAQFSSQSRDSPTCRQETQLGVACIIITPLADLGLVVKDIREALLGWQVAPEYSILTFSHQNIPYGMPMDIKGKYVWWQELYQVEYLNRTI